MFYTAFPFGYLLIALVLGGFFFAGLGLLVLGWKKRRFSLKLLGGGAMLGVVLAVMVQASFAAALEWNPAIAGDASVCGTWKDERQRLVLREDHTCEYHSDNEHFSGTWSRDDWNLRLLAEGVDSMMRFIEFAGKLRLMTHPPEDPDTWNGELGLVRQPPGSAK